MTPRAVQPSEAALLEATFASMTEGLIVYGPGGEVLRMNEAAERILGVTREEWLAAARPEDRARLIRVQTAEGEPFPMERMPLWRALRGESTLGTIVRVQARDGEPKWVSTGAAPIAGPGGEILGAVATFTDVTVQERAERALRQSEQRYRALFTNMTEGFAIGEAIMDAEGVPRDFRFLEVNDAFERETGLRRADIVGRPMREVLPGLEQSWVDTYGGVVLTGKPARFESYNRDVDRHFSVHCYRPEPGRFAIVFLDITERREAEERLRAMNEQLRETDRRRTEFLGVLSHELRNPLAPMRNGVHLLERLPADSPQAARARQVIGRQVDHLTRLVDDLLDVTRISRGKIQLRREPTDLTGLIQKACEDHRALFVEGEVELCQELSSGPVWAEVDATRVAQVVGNLLSNALKFTPAGGVVTVALAEEGDRVRIRVRDSGIGMSPEHVAHLFEPFVQEDRSLARTGGGLGLGLALSNGLVELHGGTLTASSAGPGRGAVFEVELPRVPRPAAGPTASAEPGPCAGKRVLVVEDNADAARTLADVLELYGHRVTVARDGRSGIELARRERPDVVVCDLGLPDVDGYEVARTLRADPGLDAVRLIALSGYAQPEDRERSRAAGFDAHLAKASPLEELTELIR